MLNHDIVSLIFVEDTGLTEESIGRLLHDHGQVELSAQLSTAARRHKGLNDSNLQVGTLLTEDIGSAQITRASANDDNIRLSILIQVLEVAASHSPQGLALAAGGGLKVNLLTYHFLDRLSLRAYVHRQLSCKSYKLGRA